MACWAGRQPMGRRCVFPVFKRWPLARPNRSNPKRSPHGSTRAPKRALPLKGRVGKMHEDHACDDAFLICRRAGACGMVSSPPVNGAGGVAALMKYAFLFILSSSIRQIFHDNYPAYCRDTSSYLYVSSRHFVALNMVVSRGFFPVGLLAPAETLCIYAGGDALGGDTCCCSVFLSS